MNSGVRLIRLAEENGKTILIKDRRICIGDFWYDYSATNIEDGLDSALILYAMYLGRTDHDKTNHLFLKSMQ